MTILPIIVSFIAGGLAAVGGALYLHRLDLEAQEAEIPPADRALLDAKPLHIYRGGRRIDLTTLDVTQPDQLVRRALGIASLTAHESIPGHERPLPARRFTCIVSWHVTLLPDGLMPDEDKS